LIWGGYQIIIFSILGKDQIELINNIVNSVRNKRNGSLLISPNEIVYNESSEIQPTSFNYNNDDDWIYSENIGLPLIAFIAGGGHVGLAVSRIMKSIGFYVVVFDHREDVFTVEQNEYADEIIITKYDEIGNQIIESENSYIIIVTPMHAGDKDTLKSVINKKVKYIGMMGSSRKIKSIFDALKEEGANEKLFEKIHTPIGLEIYAESPEEIAISIAAEIIRTKNQE
jgi:xanthine dehydrogenase accessory factor